MEEQLPTLKIIDDTPNEVSNEPAVPEHVHVPQRLEGETFEAYKVRRMFSKAINQANARGNLVWNSRPDPKLKGKTYVKPKGQ
jgi:hypothetical protein